MGDIFDEVVAMDDVDAETTDTSGDAHFNEAELDDIMAEIDNLEKDFEAEVVAAPAAITTDAEVEIAEEVEAPVEEMEMSAADEIVSEVVVEEIPEEVTVEMAVEEKAPIAEKVVEVAPAATKVLSFEKKPSAPAPTPALSSSSTSNVALSATGNMALNLTFKIGEENATLVIDQEKGLLVSFSGVELSLHAEKGCTVEMANGVLFTVPVQTGASSANKKSA